MAALIKEELGLDTELESGDRGEFTVWVNSQKVAEKVGDSFPEDAEALAAVKNAIK
ncbi:MAG: hypothetical protein RMM17_03590 [Acidobacteriota bacterium]|nr:Rdx family protein [Blastocatellia bacterium]MDW8411751.1 hypothetical protein [Acidobacteriota bacterium]